MTPPQPSSPAPPPLPTVAPRRYPRWFVILQSVLWLGVLILLGFAIFLGLDVSNSTSRSMRELGVAFAIIVALWAGLGALTLWLALRWRWVVILPALFIGLPMAVGAVSAVGGVWKEIAYRQRSRDRLSGKMDFGDQPALFAVADAVVRNDEAAIRAAARSVPDLQTRGRTGRTLLEFAVEKAVDQPDYTRAVKTLLALGADPNFPGGQGKDDNPSIALARAVCGPVELLRAMLDAGGNPNAHDVENRPIIFNIWTTSVYNAPDRRVKLDLLLDRGADVNAALPANAYYQAGYSLLLHRADNGIGSPEGYDDALHLLERGADFHRAAPDGMTLAKLLAKHQRSFRDDQRPTIPEEFNALCAWLTAHGETIPTETAPANSSP